MSLAGRRGLLLVGLLALAACRPTGGPPQSAEQAALALFSLARAPSSEADAGAVDRLVSPQPDGSRRVTLFDALRELPLVSSAEVVGSAKLPDPDLTVVDLTVTLPGGGIARYSVRCRRDPAERYWIEGFAGPGVEWPAPHARRGDGLTSLPSPP